MIDFQTKVLTPYGEKPISELRVGDAVLSTTSRQVVRNYVKKKVEGTVSSLIRFWCDDKYLTTGLTQYLGTKGGKNGINYTRADNLMTGQFMYRAEDGMTTPFEITGIEWRTEQQRVLQGLKLETFPFNYIAAGFVVGSE